MHVLIYVLQNCFVYFICKLSETKTSQKVKSKLKMLEKHSNAWGWYLTKD